MSNKDNTDKNNVPKRKINYIRIIQLSLLLIILIVLGIAIARFLHWDKGEEWDFDPSQLEEDYMTETEDTIIYVNPKMKRGEADDGITKVVILGDETISDFRGDNNVAELIDEACDAVVYNCSFAGTSLTSEYSSFPEDGSCPEDAFSFYWVSECIRTQDYSLLKKFLPLVTRYDTTYYEETISLLESIDFNEIDLIIIAYNAKDYRNNKVITNIEDGYDITTVHGALFGTYPKFTVNYPCIQVMTVAPTFCYYTDKDGVRNDSDVYNNGYGILADYMQVMSEVTVASGCSFLDNYFGVKINASTADSMLLKDGLVPNEAGRKLIAERIANVIQKKEEAVK